VSLRLPIRRADVLWRDTLDAVLVRPPGADEVVKLAGTGRALWAALEEPLIFADLCDVLAETHDAETAAIAADLLPVISDLMARGVLTEHDSSGHHDE
jgi:Coenzyme PQQ synthesis protein D (PqqD)